VSVEAFWEDAACAPAFARLHAAAQRIEGDVVVATDLAGLPNAIRRLIAARRAGELAALYVALADAREPLVAQVYAQVAGAAEEQRAAVVDGFARETIALDGKPLAQYTVLDAPVRRALYAALRLADAVLVDSPEHARRLEAAVGRPPNRALPIVQAEPKDVALPHGRRVVVYAPHAERAALRQFDVLFANRDFPWSVIARENARDPIPSDAAVAIAPAWARIDDALELQARGVRTVAPFTSGAPGLGIAFGYDPLRAKTLFRALDAALTEQMPSYGMAPALDGALARERATTIASGPLLSAIVRTYDRPKLLLRALDSIAAQTYRDVEAVVVNDAGPDVGDLLARYDGKLAIRYVRRPVNGGLVAAVNDGARAARGTYVGYLDDDDLWYPDHAARLIGALERTGAAVAYANCVAEYADVAGDALIPREYAIFTDRDFEKDAYLYDNLATVHSYIHRRDLFDRFGLFDEAMGAADDWEMWLRMTREIDFVHVDRVTVEYSWRRDPTTENMTFRKQRAFADAHRHVARKHAGTYARWPSLLKGRHDTAARFDALADRLEIDPSMAHAVFGPPDPQP
jgi:glycosyltransferase involved in cell wall biosynthesis